MRTALVHEARANYGERPSLPSQSKSLAHCRRVCYELVAMIEMSATVRNANGIHCRPSAVIAKEVMNYPGEIKVITENGTCDPRSIMALISMGLQEGARVRIRVSGPDEAMWCRKLVNLFEKHYDFPPRAPGEPLPIVLPAEACEKPID